MKGNIKGILLIIGAIIGCCGAYYLYSIDYMEYAIVCITLALILFIFGIKFIVNSRSPEKIYESNIKNIINTYDSVLVKSNTVPKLIGRNIIIVEDIDDMVDAQIEIRKPICYLKQTESCSFVLLDDKEAYVYVEKLNPDVISPVEIEINDIKRKQKNSEDLDSEMLKDIERTTIVRLSNKKSYKVSPIRKNENTESKKNTTIEDIEIL